MHVLFCLLALAVSIFHLLCKAIDVLEFSGDCTGSFIYLRRKMAWLKRGAHKGHSLAMSSAAYPAKAYIGAL